MTQEEIDQMTGAASMNRPTLKKRKAIRLNGKTGKFIITHLDEDKIRDSEGVEKYRQEESEEAQSVVFLKVRRRLMQGSQKDGIIKYTTEHDTISDVVTLYVKDGETESGPANVLRERHPELKTEQIVYVRWKGIVAKLSVKGLSLRGNDNTTNFYQFIAGRNDWYTHHTTLKACQDEESGYWFLDFHKGENLSEDQVSKVVEDIKEVFEDCKKVDDAYKTAPTATATQPDETSVEPEVPEYPEEEINPEDIPF